MRTFPMYIAKFRLVGVQRCMFTRADRNSTLVFFLFRKSCLLALLFSLSTFRLPDPARYWNTSPWTIPGTKFPSPMPHISPRFPGQFPLFHFLGAGSGQMVGDQSLEGSLAQIFLDPYPKDVEDSLVNLSCLFFWGAGSSQMMEEESLNKFPGTNFPKPKAQETTGTWKSGNCMRMSDVPANPLWEIRIILTKTTIAGTGHNWKATQRLLGVPCPNHPWELQFFGDAHFFG